MPYINNKEIAVHYELAGDHSKPALVLLFGFGMSCEDWLELGYVHALAPFFQIVCIDPRGHGASTLPSDAKDYALEKMASDVEVVIAELDLKSPILWGYSLGAKIALAVAGRDPAAYSALVLGGLELHSVVDLTNDRVTETLKSGRNHGFRFGGACSKSRWEWQNVWPRSTLKRCMRYVWQRRDGRLCKGCRKRSQCLAVPRTQ